jgi:hypothetical protein
MGPLTVSMAMFNSYVKLPEGILEQASNSKAGWVTIPTDGLVIEWST